MGGIVWLASYPKSGNTWVRAFLANLFLNPDQPIDINRLHEFAFGDARADFFERVSGKKLEDMTDEEMHRLRPQVHRLIASLRPETVFAKTHNASLAIKGVPLITPEVTAGAIYVVRNPLDVTVSYAHHFGLTIDETIEAMASEANHVLTIGRNVFQVITSWTAHVESWTDAPGLRLHVVRYEDMSRAPRRAFGEIAKFLRLPPDAARLNKAIRFSSFETLAQQERKHGFIEQSKNADRFFRKGRMSDWRRILTQAQVDQVIENHGKVMRKFGYLNENGSPRG